MTSRLASRDSAMQLRGEPYVILHGRVIVYKAGGFRSPVFQPVFSTMSLHTGAEGKDEDANHKKINELIATLEHTLQEESDLLVRERVRVRFEYGKRGRI